MLLDVMEKKCTGNELKLKDNNHMILDLVFEVLKKRGCYLAPFNNNVNIGDYAVVETERGLEIAKISGIRKASNSHRCCKISEILRIATDEDIKKYKFLKEDAIKAGLTFKNKQETYSLGLKLVSTEFTFDKKKLIFYFVSEDRVDFRELVRDLASIFRVRIELRQIGVRDHAKLVGDCGSCGRTLCCKSVVNKFDTVTIKQARDQNISVTPSKISGVCGRLKCCMAFEHEQYAEKQELFPIVGQTVKTPQGDGSVVSINLLNNYLFISIPNKGINRFELSEINFDKDEKKFLEKEIDKKVEELLNVGI